MSLLLNGGADAGFSLGSAALDHQVSALPQTLFRSHPPQHI